MNSNEDFFSFMTLARELVASNRPLRLRLDMLGGINEDLLLPQRVTGTETLCGGIEYRVLCVSGDVCLPLKQMIAVPAALDMVTDTGDLRSVCGIITEAAAGDSDGGLASYQLVLRDALAILEKRINTRVFRNMDEVEIVQQILNEWRHKSPILGITFTHEVDEVFHLRRYPQREFTMQHNESDAAFIRRLLKRRGIGWYIRAMGDGEAPMHSMVLFNDANSLRQNAAGIVRYHRDNATEERDAITSWTAVRTLQPGMVTRHSWDYRYPQGRDFMMADAISGVNQGVYGNELAASLDDYQILMPHAGDSNDDLYRLGQLRMTRHDYESKCFHGEGSVRDFCAGEYFTLADHPEVDDHPQEERDFVVTALRIHAHNNLPKALAARVERLFVRSRWGSETPDAVLTREQADAVASGPLRVHVQFTAVRRGVKIVPAYDARTDLPAAQMQSAIVVGPPGEEVYCDQLGRVKIRFPGTRPADHKAAGGSGALETDADSAWVRVASSWAGNGPGSLQQCGTVSLPRVGTEVLVNFLGGDPDKPVIVGQMFNDWAEPAALSEMGNLPGNRYLSGMKSREIKGGRANQLRFDDTNGEISAQLSSEYGDSQLNLGFLTQSRSEGQADKRGAGAELRSDLAIAVRATEGVLITAEHGGGAQGKHLQRDELVKVVVGLHKIAEQLSKLAQKFADVSPRSDDLTQAVEAIKQFDTVGESIVAMSGPAGVAVGSGRGVLIGAAAGIDIISSGDSYYSAGGRTAIFSAQGGCWYTNKGDMKFTAASGKFSVHAQNDAMQVLAKKVLEIISTTDWINISAKKGVRINGGGTELVLSAEGLMEYTAGTHLMHAAEHHFKGACGKEAKFPGFNACSMQASGAAQAGDPVVPLSAKRS